MNSLIVGIGIINNIALAVLLVLGSIGKIENPLIGTFSVVYTLFVSLLMIGIGINETKFRR